MDTNVHLISKTGEKIVVPHKDYNDSEMLKDGKYDDYDLDIGWYLANGYSVAEEAFRRIEGQVPNDIHFPAEEAKRLAKLYARSLINKKGYNGQDGTSNK